ncbi:DUF3102 domain-containing protein [Clostridium sp. DJ247]|uniref:DUF3102 domain-containing protein n=1 Tax=Clostridium sp. DJ247 TaxID=2726188 RepID=UPI001623EBF0|nr:DUF3102 domain-containing protein [Clostridium sp. DJ247]MBC2580825.1 DUF3102 domain-containing protein [Clostridium sp. DJ247]
MKQIIKTSDINTLTAQNFMRVANEFSNTKAISDLGITKVYALLDLPYEERETFIKENPVNEMTTRELQQAIKEKKQLEETNKLLEKSFNELSEKYNLV